jgi:SSS family solute:Na+ symporter
MKHLPVTDLTIIAVYMIAMILTGLWFSRKNKNPDQFTRASGSIPQWAVGISIYATFLSSNTFLGVPGKAFGSNWNSFVFSLSMPFSAWIAAKYFVPFYRNSGEVSAYTHLEHRFGAWARTYAVVCFLLTQLARMGSVFFGIALSLQAMTGYSMHSIMIVTGIIIIIYTVLGGMEAVIWTEVAQGIIKTAGAVIILYFIVHSIPGGIDRIVQIGKADHKFSLGSFRFDFTSSTFWVIFFYGIFINLNNFGMDQNYVQRYQSTGSATEAAKSLWLCVKLYLPVSLLFFIIGTSLYAWYQLHPEMLDAIKLSAASERLPAGISPDKITALANTLKPADYGDKILPDFMVNVLPVGVVGIIVSAILSAAMSTISSGMNACATVFTFDVYKRYVKSDISSKQTFRILLTSTFVIGVFSIISGIAMIGVKSILDMWWQLSGIFAAGMLGLFLLGFVSRQTKSAEALFAVIIGVLVIAWMTFSGLIPNSYAHLKSSFNSNMVIVIGTLAIFLVGIIFSALKKKFKA